MSGLFFHNLKAKKPVKIKKELKIPIEKRNGLLWFGNKEIIMAKNAESNIE